MSIQNNYFEITHLAYVDTYIYLA